MGTFDVAQASATATRGLLVNLMGTQVAEDLVAPAHRVGAERALENLDPKQFGLDLFAYCVRTEPKGVGLLFAVYEDERLTRDQLTDMLGSAAA